MIKLIKRLVAQHQRNKLAKRRLANNNQQLKAIYKDLELRGY